MNCEENWRDVRGSLGFERAEASATCAAMGEHCSAMFSHSAIYSLHCALCTLGCLMCVMLGAMCINCHCAPCLSHLCHVVHCIMFAVYGALCCVHYNLYILHCALCCISDMHSAQCTMPPPPVLRPALRKIRRSFVRLPIQLHVPSDLCLFVCPR